MHRLVVRSARLLAAGALALCAVSAAPAPPAGADPVTLTLYSAQHPQMVTLVTDAFTKATGIRVQTRSGEGPEIANLIAREGTRSPADVYFTENSPELVLLSERGLLAKVAPATLARVPRADSSPTGDWVGVLARQNVMVYDAKTIKSAALPHDVLRLADPAWKGRVAFAPSDADFLPLVDAVAALHGEAAALTWLRGLKSNAQVFDDDEGVVAAVDRGAVPVGIVNMYYWARPHAHDAATTTTKLAHFAPGDVGNVVNVSGAAVLRSSTHAAEAQRFLAFLVSAPVQRMLGAGEVDFEYPLAAGIPANPLLTPLRDLHAPKVSIAQLGDDRTAARLLRAAGLI